MKTHQYYINAPEPLMFLRVPWPEPPIAAVRKALSPDPTCTFPTLLPVRDGWSLEDANSTPELRAELQHFTARLDAAFTGSGEFIEYALFDWRDGQFVTVR